MAEIDDSDTADSLASWGGPADLSAWETVMWRAEGDHRTRSAGVVMELLDSEPDWRRLVAAHDRLSQRIPRLRERVVEPLLPVVAPAWSPDPHFDLGYHLQRIRLPANGAMDELYAVAAVLAARPLDPQRPPWEALLVGGLPDGKAAYLLKLHHSLTDGLGVVQLLDLTHGHGREPGKADETPMPAPRRTESPTGLLVSRLAAKVSAAPGVLVRETVRAVGRFAGDPIDTATGAVRFGQSLRRVLAPPAAPRSPALGEGGNRYQITTIDVPLANLKAAGKAAGGSVNDAFLAALLGAVRLYHEKLDATVEFIPMAMPVSLRTDDDPMGGNRFAAARFVAPVGEPDPRARIEAIHRFILEARAEPAIGFLELIAPVLSRLPGMVLTQIAGEMTGASDLQASNLAAIPRTFYLAGAKVLGVYPLGPRPGVAAMVTMVSYDGNCCIGINLDPEAITDVSAFTECLHAGFDEVLALAS